MGLALRDLPFYRGHPDGTEPLVGRVAFFAHNFAVLDPIEPGYSVRAPSAPVLPATALEAVADPAPYTNHQAGIVVEDSDRIDLDVMEHTRQSRLMRWQAQP